MMHGTSSPLLLYASYDVLIRHTGKFISPTNGSEDIHLTDAMFNDNDSEHGQKISRGDHWLLMKVV
jgi:hypothetical protein